MSRGDNRGTDALEKRLWQAAGIVPAAAGGGRWYRDIGGLALWLLSPEGQAAIGAYRIAGQQLFHPSAAQPR